MHNADSAPVASAAWCNADQRIFSDCTFTKGVSVMIMSFIVAHSKNFACGRSFAARGVY
jgi:hypothetical protein